MDKIEKEFKQFTKYKGQKLYKWQKETAYNFLQNVKYKQHNKKIFLIQFLLEFIREDINGLADIKLSKDGGMATPNLGAVN